MIVFDHHAHTLLEVARRDDLTVFGRRKAYPPRLAAGSLHHQVGDAHAVGVQAFGWEHELAAPVVAELRHHAANRLVPPRVAPGADENRRNVLGHGLDAELVSEFLTERSARRVAFALRHEDAEHM